MESWDVIGASGINTTLLLTKSIAQILISVMEERKVGYKGTLVIQINCCILRNIRRSYVVSRVIFTSRAEFF